VGRIRLVDRELAVRWIAPAVFLLAVTGVVLIVRSSLRGESEPARTTTPVVRTTAPAAGGAPKPKVPRQYYVIQSGDTLDAVAARYATTVDDLLALNPGIEPTALTPGERLRVK
jgi:LysM repeat protein